MKYKVIGWTNYEDDTVLSYDGDDSFAQRNAIIDEIRKHKYIFSGWHHQESWENCTPILNDGRKRLFSQRGWGGIMAEAYGQMGDYDYATFTFRQSIDSKKLRFPDDETSVDADDYLDNVIENESFEIEVSKELFNIAKTSNPFYLEDDEKLRYIDINDTLTIKCKDEKITVFVDDIDRNKKEVDFKDHHLIKGKYKIIVKYRPKELQHLRRSRLLFIEEKLPSYFRKTLTKYDYNILYNLFNNYEVTEITRRVNKQKAVTTLKLFLNDYLLDNPHKNQVVSILNYINEFEYYKDLAYAHIKDNPYIIQGFAKKYKDSNYDMKKHILKAASTLTKNDYYQKDLAEMAIDIKPNSAKYRKIYYKICSNTRVSGFPVMADLDLYQYLNKDDQRIADLSNFEHLKTDDILRIAEYFAYPHYNVTMNEAYPFYAPKIFSETCIYMLSGVYKYQKYCKEKFDIEHRMKEMLIYGIKRKLKFELKYVYWKEDTAKYIYALDALTGFLYELKNEATKLFKEDYPELIEEINARYSMNDNLPIDKYCKAHFEIKGEFDADTLIKEIGVEPEKIIKNEYLCELHYGYVEKYGTVSFDNLSDILYETIKKLVDKDEQLGNLKTKYNLKYDLVIDTDAFDLTNILILDGKITTFLYYSKTNEDLSWHYI